MTESTATAEENPIDRPFKSLLWTRLRKSTSLFQRLAMVLLLLTIVLGILEPWLPLPPYNAAIYVSRAYSFPTWAHPFGIDAVGRDYLSRNLYAIRTSLSIGVITAAIGALIGIPLGLVAAFWGGIVDWIVTRIVEVFSVIPPMIVAILLANFIEPTVISISLIIGLASWVPVARLVRARALTVREMPFIDAARGLGATRRRVIWVHIFPNSISTVIVALVLIIPNAIVTDASLSFLGLGISPPTPDWGHMIATSLQNISYYWYLGLFPALMLGVTTISIALVGDWLRDVLDPQSRS